MEKVPELAQVTGSLQFITFLRRVLGAIDFISTPPSDLISQRIRDRISKSAAVLVGFMIVHSAPNLLLLSKRGRILYSYYGQFHSGSLFTRLVELFLLGAGLTHGILATRMSLMRWFSPGRVHEYGHPKEMMVSGAVIVCCMLVHLLDFRFNATLDMKGLDTYVLETVDRRHNQLKALLYWLFIFSVAHHAWRGSTRAWLYRLGFREELSFLHRLCRVLIVVAFGLFCIPLLMKGSDEPSE